jgi:hypothetical protein
MEVVAYIVGETIQYDLLNAELADPNLSGPDQATIKAAMRKIEDDLATYTGSDQLNANRWMMKKHPGSFIYQWNHFVESLIPGHRIPPGGWEESLREIGFSDAAISHIQQVAVQGSEQFVGSGEVGLLGDIRTPTPTPTPTPTTTPTPTPTPTGTSSPAPTMPQSPTSTGTPMHQP